MTVQLNNPCETLYENQMSDLNARAISYDEHMNLCYGARKNNMIRKQNSSMTNLSKDNFKIKFAYLI
jgi:hypothetical protein